jgi:integrase
VRKYPSAKDLDKLTKPGRYAVGFGCYLQIAEGGSRSWLLRYRNGDKATSMGLGSCNYVTLQEARDKAYEAQRQRLNGIDPLEVKRATKRCAHMPLARSVTLEEAARQYIANQEPGWRGGASSQQWRASLATYIFPFIGSMSVADIQQEHVATALEEVWQRVPETGRRLRNRIELILAFATAKKWRSGDNPAALAVMEHLLPAHNGAKKHFAAIPYSELPELAKRLPDSIVGRAVLLCMLTATHANEVAGAHWCEIDGDTWTVPAERTKRHRKHTVPLSTAAGELLAALPRVDDEYCFPGERRAHIKPGLMLMTLKRLGRTETIHGFRAAFRTWASERTKYPDIVAELCLGHEVGSATERAYRRGELLVMRRQLLEDWANYLVGDANE